MRSGNYLDELLSKRSYVKLLRVLVLNSPTKEWSGREIARAVGIDHTIANDSLHFFVDYGLVSMRRFGNANVYRVNADHLAVRQLRNLFEAEQRVKGELKPKLAKACASSKNVLSATIYDSVAHSRGKASSDTDLLVIVNEEADLTKLFSGVETEFGNRVSPHISTLKQLRTKRKLPLMRNIVKDGEHVYGEKLENLLEGYRKERTKPNKLRPLLLAGLLLLAVLLANAPFVAAASTWTQTTQADFEAGVLTNVDTAVSPGDVKLAKDPGWWDANWTRRRPITIDPLNPENYQIKVLLPFFDNSIRFLENETTSELSYWVENCTTDNMTIWVRRLENADNTIYVYYSNPAAASASDGDATFVFFDDFLGTSLDGTKWDSWDANVSVSNSVVTITNTGAWGGISSITQYSLPYIFVARAQKTTTSGIGEVGLEKWYDGTGDVTLNIFDVEEIPTPQAYHTSKHDGTKEEDEFGTWTLSTWYHYEIKGKSDEVKYYRNGMLQNTVNTLTSIPAGPMSVLFSSEKKNDQLLVDYCFICKYASPEPTTSLGAEEGFYVITGKLASQVYDTGTVGTTWNQLSWSETLQAKTNITFEVRASDDSFTKDNVGLTWINVGETSPVTHGLPSGRYMQWRANLSTTDTSKTPILHEVTVSAVAFDFSVTASPDTLTLTQGKSATSTISVSLISGEGEVSLSGTWMGAAPTGISTVFSPQSGTPPFNSILTFTASSTASGGTFIYEVTGSGGILTHTDTIVLMLPPAAPSLVSPENGTAIDTITPIFDWADVSGAASYTLQVATDNDFSYAVFSTYTVESTTASPVSLSYGTRYYWRVRAKNNVGTGDWSFTWEFIAKLTAPKVLSFEIEAGATYTNSTSVELSISAQNAVEMSFSGDGVIWGGWELYQTSKSYVLSALDGPKNVYIRVRDNVGNISQIILDSIILDQTPPCTAHSLFGELGTESYKSSVVVTLTSTDTYEIESTKYRIDNDEWRTGDTFVISSEGKHTIEYYSMDKAGNVEEIKSFKVAVHAPTIIPDVGPWIEEILDFLRQMGPAVLIILGFAVVIAGMTRSLVALVGVGLVACGVLILLGFL